MNKKIINIPNPNKISALEHEFIHEAENKINTEQVSKQIYKNVMVSMPNSFFKKLNDYLKKNPTEGSRSSFIVRIVSEHLEKKLQ
jgi:hypothetical protein